MKVALMACSGNPEVLRNAFRMGNLMLEKMDDVTIFLNGPSVAYASLNSTEYPISELAQRVYPLGRGVAGLRQAFGPPRCGGGRSSAGQADRSVSADRKD